MKIHFPRKKAGEEGEIHDGLLRTPPERLFPNRWEMKITVPSLSTSQNLYIELSDEEMETIAEAWRRFRPHDKS